MKICIGQGCLSSKFELMKVLGFISVILCLSSVYGQDTTYAYWNYQKELTTADSAEYYLVIIQENEHLNTVYSYRLDSSLEGKYTYKYSSLKFRHGPAIGYFNDTSVYSKGYYRNNLKEGDWRYWFENGQLSSFGHYNHGKRIGEWVFYRENGTVAARESYLNDSTTSAIWYHTNGSAYIRESPYDIDPEYPGGEAEMNRYIMENVNYPEESIEIAEQGIVYVEFVVNKDGSLSDVKVIRGISDALDAEAIRAVKNMPNWTPGIQHNRPIRVRITLPITFRLG